MRSGVSGGQHGHDNTTSYFLERSGRIIVVVANYQDYADGDARRVFSPDVLVELLALAPASAFSRSIC